MCRQVVDIIIFVAAVYFIFIERGVITVIRHMAPASLRILTLFPGGFNNSCMQIS